MAKHDEYGREIPDPTPVSVPAGWSRPLPLAEQIRRMVRQEMSQHAQAQGMESFEEADDFDVDEDSDPLSPYEIPEAPPELQNGPESIDGPAEVPDSQSEKKSPVEPKKVVSGDSASTDSGTVKPPAGGSSRS